MTDNSEYYIVVSGNDENYFATPIARMGDKLQVRRLNLSDGTAINDIESISYSDIVKNEVKYSVGSFLYAIDSVNVTNVVDIKSKNFKNWDDFDVTGIKYERSKDEKPSMMLRLLSKDITEFEVFQVQDSTHMKSMRRFDVSAYSIFSKFLEMNQGLYSEIDTFVDIFAREISKSCILANLVLIRCGREIDLDTYQTLFREYIAILCSKSKFAVKFMNLVLIRCGFLGIEGFEGKGILFAYRDDSKVEHDGSTYEMSDLITPILASGRMSNSGDLIKQSLVKPLKKRPTGTDTRFEVNGYIPVNTSRPVKLTVKPEVEPEVELFSVNDDDDSEKDLIEEMTPS